MNKIGNVNQILYIKIRTNNPDNSENEILTRSYKDYKPLSYYCKVILPGVSFTGSDNEKNMLKCYENRENLLLTIKKNANKIKSSRNLAEKYIDTLGNIKLVALDKNDDETLNQLDLLTDNLFETKKNRESFSEFVSDSRKNLQRALLSEKPVVFVMGHENPDMDSVASCLAEAYRNSCIDDNAVYVPVINGNEVQNGINYILGDKIAESLLFSNDLMYTKAKNNPKTKWILVDHNSSEIQDSVIGIVDHHDLSEKSLKDKSIPITREIVGSTAALVTQKILGTGIEIDKSLAKILYGAALKDTGNCKQNKMTHKDELVVKYLGKISEIKDRNTFYTDMMGSFLIFRDSNELFYRDLRNDQFGYAICEMQNVYDKNDNISSRNQKIVEELIEIANKNTNSENYPFTLVVIYDFKADKVTVNKRRIYIVFNENIPSEYKQNVVNYLCTEHYGAPKEVVKISDGAYWFDVKQTNETISRKVKTPKILNCMNNNQYLLGKDE